MSRTKDGPSEETRKNDTRTSHEGLEEDQAKTSGARASAVAFRKSRLWICPSETAAKRNIKIDICGTSEKSPAEALDW